MYVSPQELDRIYEEASIAASETDHNMTDREREDFIDDFVDAALAKGNNK